MGLISAFYVIFIAKFEFELLPILNPFVIYFIKKLKKKPKAPPCTSTNACKNGGTCNKIGSSYYCNCPVGCQGYDCAYCPYTTTTLVACRDYNTTVCQTYAAKGYCKQNSYVNGALFKVSCRLSCKNCK